jgi:hypothetical protein
MLAAVVVQQYAGSGMLAAVVVRQYARSPGVAAAWLDVLV